MGASLKKSDLEKLIHAIISHRLDYCNVIFNNMNKENLNKLQKCHNAAAKVIVSPSHSSAVERLKELHWLPIESRVVYKILMIVFKILHGQCTTLKLHFKISNLRSGSSNQLETPNFKTKYGKRIFEYSGSRYWNVLPENIRTIDNIMKFKKELKTLLFNNFYEIKQKAFKYNPL